MFGDWLRRIGLLLLLAMATRAPANADGPGSKFKRLADGMNRDPISRTLLDHQQAHLLKGMHDNYAWLGQHWPDSRYVVINNAKAVKTPRPDRE